uniref:Secreted protein n=1 Tax=Arundo donax TaxID=35708 RepID=A0A0A9F695_ARUDO
MSSLFLFNIICCCCSFSLQFMNGSSTPLDQRTALASSSHRYPKTARALPRASGSSSLGRRGIWRREA